MLTRDDLEAAVAANIITPAQSEQILALGVTRRNARVRTWVRDERFVFMKNFNELFIAIGVILLSAGLAMASGALPLLVFAYPFVMWGLAEYLTGRLRLTLPSIVILCQIAISVAMLAAYILMPDRPGSEVWQSDRACWVGIIVLAVLCLHYWRFRLPFALLLIPAAAAFIILSLAGLTELASPAVYAIFVLVGLAAFAAAMAYDVSDPERLTRRADCAFWLNLIAAPLIVHPIASTIWAHGDMTAGTAVSILAIVAVFAVIALAIDRRAMLVSSLGYLGGTLVYIMSTISQSSEAPVWITLLLLGLFVVSLGVGWQQVRKTVLQVLPPTLHPWLPPARIS